MGFWVSTPNIQHLIAKLDWKFSDAQINNIKNSPTRLGRFDPANNRNLRKIARLMRIWPSGSADNADALKWYGFLQWLNQKQNPATGNTVAQDIRSAIYGALVDARNCHSISFVAIEGANISLTTSEIQIGPGPDYLLVVVLQTIDAGGVTAADPGPTDGNDSQDGSGEDLPAVGFAKSKRKSRRTAVAKKSKKAEKTKKAKTSKRAKRKKAKK